MIDINNIQSVEVRVDNSFVVNDVYHVPNEGIWVDEFAEISKWAEENPDKVTQEIPYVASLTELKASKIKDIANAFSTIEEKGYTTSSLGYRVDATKKSLTDVQGLIKLAEASLIPMPVQFRDYDNKFHSCTIENLKTLEVEIIAHGATVYSEKWQLEATVEAATTKDQVANINPHAMSGYDWNIANTPMMTPAEGLVIESLV